MKFYIGIDDSGRGPLIGPMLMAGVLVDEKGKEKLKKIGCRDSKLLTKKQRENLYEKIKDISLSYEIIAISPSEIDGRISTGINLNNIEAIKTAEIINTLLKIIKEKFQKEKKEIEIIVDCPSNNIPVWKNYLEKHINKDVNFILKCEHKADFNHVECSAASILAKVTRDNEIEELKKQIGIDFGSGYPSDPLTIEFLEKYSSKFKYDGIFRKTWTTWQENERKKEQKKLDNF